MLDLTSKIEKIKKNGQILIQKEADCFECERKSLERKCIEQIDRFSENIVQYYKNLNACETLGYRCNFSVISDEKLKLHHVYIDKITQKVIGIEYSNDVSGPGNSYIAGVNEEGRLKTAITKNGIYVYCPPENFPETGYRILYDALSGLQNYLDVRTKHMEKFLLEMESAQKLEMEKYNNLAELDELNKEDDREY